MIETVKVNEMRPVSMNESTEGETISPAGGHVTNLDSRIVIQLPPAPLLQGCHPQDPHHQSGSFSDDKNNDSVTLCPPLVHSGSLQHWYWCSVTRVCCWYCYHSRIVHNSFGWNSFQLLLQTDYLIENIASSEEKIYEQNNFISLQHLYGYFMMLLQRLAQIKRTWLIITFASFWIKWI